MHAHDSYSYTADPFESFRYDHRYATIQRSQSHRLRTTGDTRAKPGIAGFDRSVSQCTTALPSRGTEYFRRYENTTSTAYNSFGYSGRASYQHQFSARLSAGGGYIFPGLGFRTGCIALRNSDDSGLCQLSAESEHVRYRLDWSRVHRDQEHRSPTFCFPGFGCFGYHAEHQADWDVAGGATFGWSGVHNALRGGFSKSVTDGGGILGTVRLYLLNASYRRQMSPRWSLSSGVLYGNNLSVSSFTLDRQYNSWNANVGLERRLSPSWNLLGQYYFHPPVSEQHLRHHSKLE